MADKRLLVLGAGPAQLGVLRAARRLSVMVIAADRDPAAPGFRHADRRAIISIEDEPALERLARAERVGGILAAGSDRALALAARIATRLDLAHPVTPDTAGAASSRQRERERLALAGVAQPEAMLCHSVAEVSAAAARLGFPVAVHAVDGQTRHGKAVDAGGLGGAVALALHESRGDSCLVERASEGPHVLVAGFVAEGRFAPLLVADELADIASGEEAYALLWPSHANRSTMAAAIATATRTISALGIEAGPVWLRLAITDSLPVVERVAPRLGANHEAELSRAAFGIDLNVLTVRAALGDQVAARELTTRPRARAVCLSFLYAEPGELRAVTGLAEAFGAPEIIGIRIYRRPGHVFREPERGASRAGAVLAVGRDRVEALAASAKAAGLIRFETADATALV